MEEQQITKQKVELFARRFGETEKMKEGYRKLAYHAAIPLVLTPELVHYLRVEFLLDEVPWEAEADLLLSDLCSQVGYELYAIETEVRAYLLAEMKEDKYKDLMPAGRSAAVAKVLMSYVDELKRLNPEQRQKEIQAQRWAALGFMGEAGCQKMVEEMLAQFVESGGMMDRSTVRAEFARLAQITEEMAAQLANHDQFLALMAVVNRSIRDPDSVTREEGQRVFSVAGQNVRLPSAILPQQLVILDACQNASGLPDLKTFEFEVAEYRDGELVRSHPPLQQSDYEFEVATIAIIRPEIGNKPVPFARPPGKGGKKPPGKNFRIERRQVEGFQYVEPLSSEIALALVKVPGGEFAMGAPESELESYDDERPVHQVKVREFYMGKYAVTQAQWRFVAESIAQVNIELDPDPSGFKGDDLPVEQVSWFDAIEFCDRLSAYTGREYRLPTEAEWEYACRGGTTTAFHFGETIDAEVANYRAQDWTVKENTYPGKYGPGRLGEFREKTIAVGSLKAANEFGLHDMHGNVWEWCMDHWHDNYEGAPIDGSAWVESDREKDADRLLRGGSWVNDPRFCRSACRDLFSPDNRYNNLGFRLVSSMSVPARILP
jgi:formylglycine-generating enzyme required for sulfatase activity